MIPLNEGFSNGGSRSCYWTPLRLLVAAALVAGTFGIITYFIVQTGAWCSFGYVGATMRTTKPSSVPRSTSGHSTMRPSETRSPLDQFNLENLTVSKDEIHRGAAKDAIPSLTMPVTTAVENAEFLGPQERVIGVTVNGESRVYPVSILTYHEAINDKLGGVPIAVIYCPLCDSASVVDRRLGDETYEFAISGLLQNSNVLMYDRTDHALWSQVGLKSISGPNAGQSLKHLNNWQLTAFDTWRRQKPDSTVVTFDTGHNRSYRRNPYLSYFWNDQLVFPASPTDTRFRNKEPVIGVKLDEIVRAYPIVTVMEAENGIVRDTIGGAPIELRVSPQATRITISQAPDEAQVVYTFWFAWAAFHPGTEVYGQDAGTEGADVPESTAEPAATGD